MILLCKCTTKLCFRCVLIFSPPFIFENLQNRMVFLLFIPTPFQNGNVIPFWVKNPHALALSLPFPLPLPLQTTQPTQTLTITKQHKHSAMALHDRGVVDMGWVRFTTGGSRRGGMGRVATKESGNMCSGSGLGQGRRFWILEEWDRV